MNRLARLLVLLFVSVFVLPLTANATPLHTAAQNGDVAAVEEQLLRGRDINSKDSKGYTPLHYASTGHVGVVQRLLNHKDIKVNANSRSGRYRTPIHISSFHGQLEISKMLINRGAKVKAEDLDDNTPLHYAAKGGDHVQVATLLLQNGANIHAENDIDCTALHRAALWNRRAIAELLIINGARINASDCNNNRMTPLHLTAIDGSYEVATLLINKGADKYAKDRKGRTPLQIADENGHKNILALLTGIHAPTPSRPQPTYPLPAATQTGNICCALPVATCQLPSFLPLTTPCSCLTPYGEVYGAVCQ